MTQVVTLREAHRIVERLNAVLKEPLKLTRELNRHDFPAQLETGMADLWLHDAQDAVAVQIRDRAELTTIRSRIRNDIQSTNIDSGLTAVIAERKEAIDLITFYNSIVNQTKGLESYPTATTVGNMLRAQLEQTRAYYGENSITVVPASVVIQAKEKVQRLQKRVDSLGDKIAQLNTTMTIKLRADTVEQLSKFSII